ncbi:MAG: nucleotidyltransferase domain-containing protein [Deltaproteobacteria bacterium]|nr:nucleotidyltransferase domain-containing protein [Deltaproteobacteria bacterium]MCB9788670.1 nucleotidyltransferase domain-containing protein [Deltaproteobacteria bacterium]
MGNSADQSYIDGWRQRQRALAEAAAAWRRERLSEAAEAARQLSERFPSVRRVVLFGSLARGSAGPGSDVDLWLEGLAEADWLDAVSLARQRIPHAEVDLVRAEWARAPMAARVAAEGVVLSGR